MSQASGFESSASPSASFPGHGRQVDKSMHRGYLLKLLSYSQSSNWRESGNQGEKHQKAGSQSGRHKLETAAESSGTEGKNKQLQSDVGRSPPSGPSPLQTQGSCSPRLKGEGLKLKPRGKGGIRRGAITSERRPATTAAVRPASPASASRSRRSSETAKAGDLRGGSEKNTAVA